MEAQGHTLKHVFAGRTLSERARWGLAAQGEGIVSMACLDTTADMAPARRCFAKFAASARGCGAAETEAISAQQNLLRVSQADALKFLHLWGGKTCT